LNGVNISGATSSIFTIDSVSTSDTATNYNVIIYGICANDTSANVSLSLCSTTGIASVDAGNTNQVISIYPNPFMTSINIRINSASQINTCELRIYNILGEEVINTMVSKQSNNLKTTGLPAGVYFYNVISNNKIVQSGKLISHQ
jgi:hypothetical protein